MTAGENEIGRPPAVSLPAPFVRPSQVPVNAYPFAIMNGDTVRGICATQEDARELASILTRTNGGTAEIVDRRKAAS